ncbi:hypothetical protein GE21DRAFT_8892 [Neurospora crassa]|uniref:Cyanovirin-N domain-containing protein n=1 Tax=Neurospora crassa (strain ATCC 24698 / 74-OR23-1A / CBS 708.71 / DSM 1257 / FGSC 987) TaxID=367110 RepID=V5ILE1_NEUCR|nr:hypothetical protein NCU17086 [Neurospora crassa OR74A]ESA42165.1 hypothetical protein NCU17086 [Neurospora crassa OR74A]KHE80579.1 hypothetical protein GE21DRAFT_8892 [Neurospora crassa]|eukprot:XP_011395085.1 hypothetical protein NCU17086 [Neurospora crassa OR74A]
MLPQSLSLIVSISAGFLSYIQLLVTAAAVALPVQPEVGASSPHALVTRGDAGGGGSSVEGGYYNLCHFYPTINYINNQLLMKGQCASDQTGPLQNTAVFLNPCYTNIDGGLFAVTDGKGDFTKSCKECHIPSDAKVPKKIMRCVCERFAGDKEPKETEVDLDQHIHVFEDKLGCPGAEGYIRTWF